MKKPFCNVFTQALDSKNRVLQAYGGTAIPLHETYLRYVELIRQLRDRIVPIFPVIDAAVQRNDRVLLEGAQGVLLDVDWGTYPYVTSSSPGAAGACQGTGIGPRDLSHVAGVFKAYCTRVGEGPFPTELTGALGDRLRELGAEYGTTTGRARRCGWFDAVAARYVQRLNSIDQLIITKLDILDQLPEISICTHYRLHDTIIDYLPTTAAVLSQIEPVYETMPGWCSPTAGCRSFDDLPSGSSGLSTALGNTGWGTNNAGIGRCRDVSR